MDIRRVALEILHHEEIGPADETSSNNRTVDRQQCRTNSQTCDSDVRYGRAEKNRIQGDKVPLLGSSKNVSHCDP